MKRWTLALALGLGAGQWADAAPLGGRGGRSGGARSGAAAAPPAGKKVQHTGTPSKTGNIHSPSGVKGTYTGKTTGPRGKSISTTATGAAKHNLATGNGSASGSFQTTGPNGGTASGAGQATITGAGTGKGTMTGTGTVTGPKGQTATASGTLANNGDGTATLEGTIAGPNGGREIDKTFNIPAAPPAPPGAVK